MGVEASALSVAEVVGREGTKGCPFIDQDRAPKEVMEKQRGRRLRGQEEELCRGAIRVPGAQSRD